MLSYLVSTAGHAAEQNAIKPHHIGSILQLIQDGAQEFGDEKVVGFTSQRGEKWICDCYSFQELIGFSNQLSSQLEAAGIPRRNGDEGDHIVSLLAPTGLEFLVAWIALMHLGYGVVLIAPQCSAPAITELISTTKSSFLIYHRKYANLAERAQTPQSTFSSIELPILSEFQLEQSNTFTYPEAVSSAPPRISHVFHTSGTSGFPKPIPHRNEHLLSALPRRPLPAYIKNGESTNVTIVTESAAFTTTPLFHGGASDLLRAWMARSMIYFYPTSDRPVTVENVVAAVQACDNAPSVKAGVLERQHRFRLDAFLSVPYILETLAEDNDGPGIRLLKRFQLVSTGGAPLNVVVGDKMVKAGLRLVSRLGSSECGFLLTSYRDFDNDLGWDWLHNDSGLASALHFKRVEGDASRSELIVTKNWPGKTKSNGPNDSYATGDLFERHPDQPEVWRHVGRGDDVVVLSNGEKASPGPFESMIRGDPDVIDALVVGANKDQLGLLIFSRPGKATQLEKNLTSILERVNKTAPTFARLSPDMCTIIEDQSKTEMIPKSSKGTIQRIAAYKVFQNEIDRLYSTTTSAISPSQVQSITELQETLRGLIQDIMSERASTSLEPDTDLFSWGVDSLIATRLRARIIRQIPTGNQSLPRNVVFEYPTINALATLLHACQLGEDVSQNHDSSDEDLMRSLADQYSFVPNHSPSPTSLQPRIDHSGSTLVLTGATGFLGTSILDALQRKQSPFNHVVCLVRAENDAHATKRVRESMVKNDLVFDVSKISAVAADLTRPDLGLSSDQLQSLLESARAFIHAAWPVHFTSSLRSYEANIKGLHNLIQLILRTSARLFFCSSLASVLASKSANIEETSSNDPLTATNTGYSKSKWVAERLCGQANAQTSIGDRVHVLRVGQLCASSRTGIWNEKEAWPLLFKSACVTGTLPELYERLSWLPVDKAADIILDIAASDCKAQIYHVVQPSLTKWSTILAGLKQAGLQYDTASPAFWLENLRGSSDDATENPSKQLLGLWEDAYGGDLAANKPEIMVTNAKSESSILQGLEAVNEEDVRRMAKVWFNSGFLQ